MATRGQTTMTWAPESEQKEIFSTCIARIMSHSIYKRDRAFSTSPVFFSENILAQVPDIQLVKHGREIGEGTVNGFVSVLGGSSQLVSS